MNFSPDTSGVRACEWKAIAKAWVIYPPFLLSLVDLKKQKVNDFAIARYAIKHRPIGISFLESVLAACGILRETGFLMANKICCGYVDNAGITHKCGIILERNFNTATGKDSHGLCGRCFKKSYQVLATLKTRQKNVGAI